MEAIVVQTGQIQGKPYAPKEEMSQCPAATQFINVLTGLFIAKNDEKIENNSFSDLVAGFSRKEKELIPSQEAQELMAYLLGFYPNILQPELMANESSEEALTVIESLASSASAEEVQLPKALVADMMKVISALQEQEGNEDAVDIKVAGIRENLQTEAESLNYTQSSADMPFTALTASITDDDLKAPQLAFKSESEFSRMIQKVRSEIGQSSEAVEETDAYIIQKLVDAGYYQTEKVPLDYQNIFRAVAGKETEEVPNPADLAEENIVNQVKTNVMQHLKNKDQEFVIKLKPEELGEITVRLVQESKDLTLIITAAKDSTVDLLNSQLNLLQEALRPYQAQIQPVTAQSGIGQEANWQQSSSFAFNGNQSFSSFAGFARDHGPGRQVPEFYGKNAVETKEIYNAPKITLNQQGLDCYI